MLQRLVKGYAIFLIVLALLPVLIHYLFRIFYVTIHELSHTLSFYPMYVSLLVGAGAVMLVLLVLRSFRIPLISAMVGGILGLFEKVFYGAWVVLIGIFSFFTWRPSQSRFMGIFERTLFFLPWHLGLTLDGKGDARLSEERSFQGIIGTGSVGSGKSAGWVLPNIYTLAREDCSMVITDISGELYEQASGYLKRKGFHIETLNLIDVSRSMRFNPLLLAHSHTEIGQIANVLVSAAFESNADSAFWNKGGERILRILIQALRNQGEERYLHLAQVKALLADFDVLNPPNDGSRMDKFIVRNTRNDAATFQDYKGFCKANDKGLMSFLTTADTSLEALGNPEIQRLTSAHDFDFAAMRQRKTALFVMVRETDLEYFEFLLNLFYAQIFNVLFQGGAKSDLPAYLLLDEFAQMRIPQFDKIAATARKHRIGLFLILQSLSQLEAKYGKKEAETIIDSLGTDIHFGGMGLETAHRIQRRLGRNKVGKSGGGYQEENLMNEADIIRLKDHEAIMFYTNHRPIKLKVRPYYKQARLRRYANMRSAPLPQIPNDPVEFTQL